MRFTQPEWLQSPSQRKHPAVIKTPFTYYNTELNDKIVIEPIAEQLSEIFGKENFFYDSWSIQPGDDIK